MSIPVGEILSAIGSVSQVVGQDLLPLFQQHLPKLRTDPLPDAAGEMNEARAEAVARIKSDADELPSGASRR